MKIVKLLPIALFVSLTACDQFTDSAVETVEPVEAAVALDRTAIQSRYNASALAE